MINRENILFCDKNKRIKFIIFTYVALVFYQMCKQVRVIKYCSNKFVRYILNKDNKIKGVLILEAINFSIVNIDKIFTNHFGIIWKPTIHRLIPCINAFTYF